MTQTKIILRIVVFSIQENKLMVLLDNNGLLKDTLQSDTSLDEIAKKIFVNQTNIPIKNNYIEQLYTFLHVQNPQEVSIVYYLLLPKQTTVLPKNLTWQEAETIFNKSPDFQIIQYAIQRLQWKIEYTNVIYSLLPVLFTLSELQEAYEVILGEKLDKRNFRKKILSLQFLEETGKKRISNSRPAKLFKFKKHEPTIVKVFS